MSTLTVVISACGMPSARVTVAPDVFDTEHEERAWYIHVTEERASGLRLVHHGYVCDSKPAEFTIRMACPEHTKLRGTVWRVTRSHCGKHPPFSSGLTIRHEGWKRIAVLDPVILWRGRSREDCKAVEKRSCNVELHPPIEPIGLWLSTDYWADPVYRLEPQ